ncbi:sensor histidine kinase [Rosettibacter firmus]|uniref:sensor histidine kinase n=1 Tax=Rosettibacter firmus TaxID=3111522 RepID=UPI00336BD591
MNLYFFNEIYFNKKSGYYHLQLTLFFILSLIALAVAFQHYFIIEPNSKQHFSLFWHIPFNLFYWLFWFFVAPLIYLLVQKYDKNNFKDFLILYIVVPLFFVSIHQIISAVIINLALNYLDLQTLIYRRILRNQWLWVDIVIYFIIEIGIYIVESLEKNKKEEITLSKLKHSITESQINILRNHIHPHFLFNTFNTLSTLILKGDESKALKLIKSIKELLAKSLRENNNSLIPLYEELDLVINYLEIEKLRFGERLNYKINYEKINNVFVPNFILQPLVENSIRHGIAKQNINGLIVINISQNNEHLNIVVEDNGLDVDMDNIFSEKGLGLKIIRRQLEYFFDKDFQFNFSRSELGGLKVLIKFPVIISQLKDANATNK